MLCHRCLAGTIAASFFIHLNLYPCEVHFRGEMILQSKNALNRQKVDLTASASVTVFIEILVSSRTLAHVYSF